MLQAQRLYRGEHPLDEAAAGFAVAAVARFAPNDGVPDRPLRGIVRRVDPVAADEGPQRVLPAEDLAAHRGDFARRAPNALAQEIADLVLQRAHVRAEGRPFERA